MYQLVSSSKSHAHQFSTHCKVGTTYCKCLVQIIEKPTITYLDKKTAPSLVPDQMMLSARSIICIGYQQCMHGNVYVLKRTSLQPKVTNFTCPVVKHWLVITSKLQSSHQAQMFITNKSTKSPEHGL